jgi:hypothetical protein
MAAHESWACQVPGCDHRDRATTQWCWMHYARWRRSGDTAPPPTRPRDPRECTVGWCTARLRARGLCSMHYMRHLRGQPLEPRPQAPAALACSIDWCARPPIARGLCEMHYERQRRGQPLEPRDLSSSRRQPRPVRICTTPDCTRQARYTLFCSKHYEAQRQAAARSNPDPPAPRRG